MSNGRIPIWANQGFYSRRNSNRPIYITCAELFQWAYDKTNSTQEGDQYHDALTKFQNAMKAIASLFDGTMGTYTDPMTGTTKSYPQICDWNDILDMYMDEYNARLVAMPLFDSAYAYKEDNDLRWYNCLISFCGRIQRLVKFMKLPYSKIVRSLVAEYNPLADYFSKETEIGGNAPYASIEDTSGVMSISDWTKSNGKNNYQSESQADSTDKPTTKNYTTTYDDAATGRLAGYSETTGKTTNKNEIPNSAYFKNRNVEGNDASSPQEALERELALANALMDIVHMFCEEINKEVFIQIYAKG